MKKVKKVKILLVVLMAVTLYANIGWMTGSYYFNHIYPSVPSQLTTLGKIAAGGCYFAAQGNHCESEEVGAGRALLRLESCHMPISSRTRWACRATASVSAFHAATPS